MIDIVFFGELYDKLCPILIVLVGIFTLVKFGNKTKKFQRKLKKAFLGMNDDLSSLNSNDLPEYNKLEAGLGILMSEYEKRNQILLHCQNLDSFSSSIQFSDEVNISAEGISEEMARQTEKEIICLLKEEPILDQGSHSSFLK